MEKCVTEEMVAEKNNKLKDEEEEEENKEEEEKKTEEDGNVGVQGQVSRCHKPYVMVDRMIRTITTHSLFKLTKKILFA